MFQAKEISFGTKKTKGDNSNLKPSKIRIKEGAKKAKGQTRNGQKKPRNGQKKTRNINERVLVIQIEFIGCIRVL